MGCSMFIHIDLDSFFVSAHRVYEPRLRDIAVAVGGRSNNEIFESKRNQTKLINHNSGAFVAPVFDSVHKNDFQSRFVDIDKEGKKRIRGIIVTASYEARAKGVKTAMSINEALQYCPELLVIPSYYPLYHHLSFTLHQYLQSKIPQVEQFSIDEWFGDLRGWIEDKDVFEFCVQLQKDIKDRFNLPVSIGIARSKWTAKLATQYAKPSNIKYIDDVLGFIDSIAIKKFPGIGKGFARRLEAHGIKTLGQVVQNKHLLYSWKKPGIQLYHRVCGDDNEMIYVKNERKSIGLSRTFDPIFDKEEIRRRILIMCRNIVFIVKDLNVFPSTYYLKINYKYNVKTKETITVNRIFSEQQFKYLILQMFEHIYKQNIGVIKLSLHVSNFVKSNKTYSLFEYENDRRYSNLTNDIQKLRKKYGLDIIKSASEIKKGA